MTASGRGQPNGFAHASHTLCPSLHPRKHGLKTGVAPQRLERWSARFVRLFCRRNAGLFAVTLLGCVSLIMLVNNANLTSFSLRRFTYFPFKRDLVRYNERSALESAWKKPATVSTQISPRSTWEDTMANSNFSTGSVSSRILQKRRGSGWNTSSDYERGDLQRPIGETPPFLFSESALPFGHPCQGFKIPPPPSDKKRTGPRPCPVCYLPVKAALKEMPASKFVPAHILKELSYVHLQNVTEAAKLDESSDFAGHQTLEERAESFHIQESMHIHCGFTRGLRPGVGSGFDFDKIDQLDMDSCQGVVVASAIFGNYDVLQQPKNMSEEARNNVCFFMFVDEETAMYLSKTKYNETSRKIGLWRIVVIHNLPYLDARRNGKVPKLLIHRLFPNAQFSIWVDGKLELVVDPYQILERFLWRSNDSFAISKHYRRFDVYVEAEANKAAGKYDNASIDAQVEFYRNEGLAPFSSSKHPIVSDVPEGCAIIREHTPITNLFGCLWFNEVDRFTSRDQLSFAIVRDKIMAQTPWKPSMFLDCERRNFVVQAYHKDLLETLSNHTSSLETTSKFVIPDTQVKDSLQPQKQSKLSPTKKTPSKFVVPDTKVTTSLQLQKSPIKKKTGKRKDYKGQLLLKSANIDISIKSSKSTNV